MITKEMLLLSTKEKAIMMGLFLSRFDHKGLTALGFSRFNEAFNVLGYSIGIKPSSIKNYRDEFDPIFPNARKGWHGRDMRDYCARIKVMASTLSFNDFLLLLKIYVNGHVNIDVEDLGIIDVAQNSDDDISVAKRLMTGKAAEEYFVMNYNDVEPFHGLQIKDTTLWGCGFDFKLYSETKKLYVEVKGRNGKTGDLLMTNKEYGVARQLRDNYCLFVVSNFREEPDYEYFFNPTECGKFAFTRQEHQLITTTFNLSYK